MQFSIPQQQLINLVSLYQQRIDDADEINYLIQKGGINYLYIGLQSEPTRGILKNSLRKRIKQYGRNKLNPKQIKSFFTFFYQSIFNNFTLKILIVAAIFQIIIQEITVPSPTSWIEGIGILVAVLICAIVTSITDYQKQKQFQQLNKVCQRRKSVTVIRSSEITYVNQKDLVTGDIIVIRQGMEIGVDGWLIENNQIFMDESNMNGQSQLVPKITYQQGLALLKNSLVNQQKQIINKSQKIPSPILLSGTKVASGQGKMLCLVVGKSSSLGKIVDLSNEKLSDQTPLQVKLQKLAEQIGKFGLYASIIIFFILLLRFAQQRIYQKSITLNNAYRIVQYFILSITMIVVAIPQGLPLAVTLTLAYSVKKMLLSNNLVRRLQACEIMGGASQICSDKTGTITLNKMSVVMWWNQSLKDVIPYTEVSLVYEDLSSKFIDLLLVNIFVNSSAQLRPQIVGSATEIALMKFAQRLGKKYQLYRFNYKIFLKLPFSSNRKRMSVITQFNNQRVLVIKGASEILLNCCNKWLKGSNFSIQPINQKSKIILEYTITKMAENGLRTLVLAYKPLNNSQNLFAKNPDGVYQIQEKDLILIAIFGVRDLPRQEVPSAISKCKKAGIKVRMVTGDNLLTAMTVAKQIGIIESNQNSICLQGPQFNRIIGGIICKNCRTQKCDCSRDPNQAKKGKLVRKDIIKNQEQFDRIIQNLDVLARSRPEDKYALVTGLINKGYIVAVTGDGTNDAPALRKADVGFAMGKSGTDIARQSSSIILLDDNFTSIVKAVLWGRNVNDSVKKFIQFQLTVNIVSVSITLIGAAVLQQEIFRPIQLLWVNLIMDTLASLALATQTPNPKLLDRPPIGRYENIISLKMKKQIIFQSIYQILSLCLLIFFGEKFIPQLPDQFDQILKGDLASKYYKGIITGGTVVSGRYQSYDGRVAQFSLIFAKYGVNSRHFTVIFNTFVIMQIFNFFNSRRIYDQLNIFEKLKSNLIFLIVVGIVFVLQIIIITFGSIVFGFYNFYGLNLPQWLFCMIFGLGTLLISFLIKFVPQQIIFSQEAESSSNLSKFSNLFIRENNQVNSLKRAFIIPNKSK